MRFAARTFDGLLLFQLPPRLTRVFCLGQGSLMQDTGSNKGSFPEGQAFRPASPPEPSLPNAAVVEEAYQFWLWLDARVASFPVLARRQMGHRMLEAALEALVNTTEAVYSRGHARLDCLHAVNRSLAVARILLRGARDRRYVSLDQHDYALPRIDAWGRQIGGWLRAERARASGGPPR